VLPGTRPPAAAAGSSTRCRRASPLRPPHVGGWGGRGAQGGARGGAAARTRRRRRGQHGQQAALDQAAARGVAALQVPLEAVVLELRDHQRHDRLRRPVLAHQARRLACARARARRGPLGVARLAPWPTPSPYTLPPLHGALASLQPRPCLQRPGSTSWHNHDVVVPPYDRGQAWLARTLLPKARALILAQPSHQTGVKPLARAPECV